VPGVFPKQITAMRGMEFSSPNPGWNLVLGKRGFSWKSNAVPEAAMFPFEDDGPKILAEGLLVAAPHQNRGMMFPSGASPRQDIQYLQRFHTLLSQAFVVQASRRLSEIGVRKKCLHRSVIV